MSDKTLKEKILEQLKGVKVLMQEAGIIKKDEPVTLKDGKVLTGELKEGIEIKCGDAAIEDGTFELSDGRKFTAKEGKFVAFEVVESKDDNEALKAEIESLKSEKVKQDEKITALESKFSKVLEATDAVVKSVETIALAMEADESGAAGGGDGTQMITKSEWVTKQITQK